MTEENVIKGRVGDIGYEIPKHIIDTDPYFEADVIDYLENFEKNRTFLQKVLDDLKKLGDSE